MDELESLISAAEEEFRARNQLIAEIYATFNKYAQGDIDEDMAEIHMNQLENAFPFLLGVEEIDDNMDGDDRSALASAGFGADENYGGTDERY